MHGRLVRVRGWLGEAARRVVRSFAARRGGDVVLAVLALVLCLGTLPALYSALVAVDAEPQFYRHLVRILAAAALALGLYCADYRRIAQRSPVFFVGALALSLFAVVAAGARAGTRRWLDLGAFTIQPGEFAKLALILLLAQLISRTVQEPPGRRAIVGWAVAIVACAVALAAQPDLGNGAILVATGAGMFAISGSITRQRVYRIAFGVAVALPALWIWGLRDYQKSRILSFLSPESDPLGAGYQALQAAIAVGHGGFSGVGWLEGSQTGYGFLPAPHTDFILAVVAEEFGFLGVAAVLALFLALCHRLLDIASRAAGGGDRLGALIVGGVFLMLASQGVYNIAMVAGVVPVKGFTLPLVSYGGNSLLVTAAALGLAAGVRRGPVRS